MKKIKVYHNVRKEAVIWGMKSNNFWIFLIVEIVFFMNFLGGVSLFKLFLFLIISAVNYAINAGWLNSLYTLINSNSLTDLKRDDE